MDQPADPFIALVRSTGRRWTVHPHPVYGLLLCAVVICLWPNKRAGMTRAQAETVALVKSQLIGDHLFGRFPDGSYWAF
jgi:hypothetical protein